MANSYFSKYTSPISIFPYTLRERQVNRWLAIVTMENSDPEWLAMSSIYGEEGMISLDQLANPCESTHCLCGHIQFNFAETYEQKNMSADVFASFFLGLDFTDPCNSFFYSSEFYGREELSEVSRADVVLTLIGCFNSSLSWNKIAREHNSYDSSALDIVDCYPKIPRRYRISPADHIAKEHLNEL